MASSFFLPGEAGERAYSAIRDLEAGSELRSRVEAMWDRFRPLCGDDHQQFLIDARRRFHARIWEMYLACTLLERGFTLRRPPAGGPDLLVESGRERLWIEATAPENGTGDDAPRPFPGDGEMHTVERDLLLLRYTAALLSKWTQWSEFQRRGVLTADDPYIVAVSGAAVAHADIAGAIPDIVRALFGLGEAQYPWIRESQTFGPPQFPPHAGLIKKSGASVPLDFFMSEAFAMISGVFFSPLPIWRAPGAWGSDLHFVHNHLARHRLPKGTFPFGVEWWFDPENSTVNWQNRG